MTSDPSTSVEPATTTLDESSVLGRNKNILLAALKQGGIISATVTYAGCGDSGGVEEVSVEAPEGIRFDLGAPITTFVEQSVFQDGSWHPTVVEQQMSIEQALRDFAAQAVAQLHEGWYDGNGASGEVVFGCQSDTVRVEHTAYFIDSDYEESVL